MMEKHYIQWIELLADGKVYRQYLKPMTNLKQYFMLKLKMFMQENIVIYTDFGKVNRRKYKINTQLLT